MVSTKIQWHASEFQTIEPFRRSDEALASCTLRLTQSEEHTTDSTRNIEECGFWLNFAPEIKIVLDAQRLAEDVGINADELSTAVILRDRILNRFVKVHEWTVRDLPITPITLSKSWQNVSQSQHIDISIIVTPTQTKNRNNGVAIHRGSVVSSRTFKIRALTQGPSFPKVWMQPASFEERGCSPNSVWLLNWLAEDFERPIQECVELWVNEKYREKFEVITSEDRYTNPFKSEMASAVLSEMVLQVFRDSQAPIEESGMKAQILDMLAEASQRKPEDILAMIDQPTFWGLTHAWIQEYTGLNTSIRQL